MAVAEIGDKTQLLSLVLAARYRKPWTIVLGILVATVANHALAGAVGAWLTQLAGPERLRWILGLSFIAMAGWAMIPDRLGDDLRAPPRLGVLATTIVVFFLAEMGDKTQLATVALAARFPAFVEVVAGTTLGMLLANAPIVFLGESIATRIPLRVARGLAAAVFAALGLFVLLGPGG